MEHEHCHEIQQWLLKSRRDLQAAELLFQNQLFDVVVYHCQQSAEKSLKAYLTYREVVFQKTHNLSVLLQGCLVFEPDFEILRVSAETLTPFATEFRYPGDVIEPSQDEAAEALEMADLILNFVVQLLPDEVLSNK